MEFMLSPVYQGPRISASFSSEFHPEKKKKMKKTQPGKAVHLSQGQRLIHFSKIFFVACFSSLSFEAGDSPKDIRMVLFTCVLKDF